MSLSSSDWKQIQTYWYMASLLITVGFLCIIIKPLWTLANGRPVLMIVFNKAILSLIDAAGWLLTKIALKWDLFETWLFIWRLQSNLIPDILVLGTLLNIVALALNRMHCIMWPFYTDWISKKKIVIQCILIWFLAILLGIGMHQQKLVAVYQACEFIVFVAFGLYLIVGAKLAWIKCSSNNLLQSAGTEKDFYKITIVCLGSFIPWLISFLAMEANINTSDTNFRISMQIVQSILEPFIYCAEELCLVVLLADFRRIINKFWRGIFCRWKRGNLNNSQNVIMVMPSKSGLMPISSVTR